MFGPDVDAERDDLDDAGVRAMLLDDELGEELEPFELAVAGAIANQILDDDPPLVWMTAQRLLAAGRDRVTVLRDLIAAFEPIVRSMLAGIDASDPAIYVTALDALPYPSPEEIEALLLDLVATTPNIDATELFRLTAEGLGRDVAEPAIEKAIDRVFDELVSDPFGPIDFGFDDGVAHIGSVTAGIVLTHRLTDIERETHSIDITFDLAGFLRRVGLHLTDGRPIKVVPATPYTRRWVGPDGWLDDYPPEALLAVRVDADGVVQISGPLDEPPTDEALPTALRVAYDDLVAEPWLPVSGEDLIIGMLLRDPGTFAEARAPLTDLAMAAGLELRRHEVAHEAGVWDTDMRGRRMVRIMHAFDEDHVGARSVLDICSTADLVFGVDPAVVEFEDPLDDDMLRGVLTALAEDETFDAVTVELFEDAITSDPDARPRAATFVEALLGVAVKPIETATAHHVAARQAEATGDPKLAEHHLALAYAADGSNGTVIDRLAWYASDRGDAPRALGLWRQLQPTPALELDLAMVEAAVARTGPKVGRNDPCWCGSGRKSKQCHRDAPALPPRPERFAWLCRKAVGYLDRGPAAGRRELIELTMSRADDPDDLQSLHEAIEDPIVRDLLLTEGGWFRRFLDDRGALLPDDERALAESWTQVDRGVHEVTEVRPDDGLELREVQTGERRQVRDRLVTHHVAVGDRLCARPLPDGEGYQLFGGVFVVPAEDEVDVVDALGRHDPHEIAGLVRELHRHDDLFGHPTIARALDEHLSFDEDDDELWGREAAFLATPAGGAMLDGIREKYEDRWCDEALEALDGRTPRQAAADPDRREDLGRVLEELTTAARGDNPVALRVERLRELLDLADD